ncbi:MAG: EamA family transporter [Bacteroidales bacterium]|nr:EamA family transporter [Bacteroidales bacterium]
MSERNKTLLLLHLAVLLAGGTGLFGRLISLSGLPLVCYRVMVSIVCMTLFMFFTGKLKRIPRSSVLMIAGCGVLLAIHWVFFYASIQASNVSVGVTCIATSCFFTTLFLPIVNRSRFSLRQLLISFISIAGTLLIFTLDVRYRLGIAFGLLCAAVYSLFSILNKRVAAATGSDSPTMLFYELLGGGAFLIICMPLMALVRPGADLVPSTSDIWALLLLGSVFTLIPFLLQIHALARLSPFTVNVTYNLEPVYSIIFAAILFGEATEVGLYFWLGLGLVILSVVLQTVEEKRNTDS